MRVCVCVCVRVCAYVHMHVVYMLIQRKVREECQSSGWNWSGQGLHPSYLWIVPQSQTKGGVGYWDLLTYPRVLSVLSACLRGARPGSSSVTPRCEGEGVLLAYGY